MAVGLDPSILAGINLTGTSAAQSGSTASVPAKKYAPTAPWTAGTKPNPGNNSSLLSKAALAALSGGKFIDESAAKLDLPGASSDYKKLFTLFQGLNTLSGLVDQIKAPKISTYDQAKIRTAFDRGLKEVLAYEKSLKLDHARLTLGDVTSLAKSSIGNTVNLTSYASPTLVSGNLSNQVDAFQGDVRFQINVSRRELQTNDAGDSVSTTVNHVISVNLADMGDTPRTLSNVVSFLNEKLTSEGLKTQVEVQRTPGSSKTIVAGGKTISMGKSEDTFALKFKLNTSETVSFSAESTAPVVYVGQTAGNPNPDGNPLTQDGKTSSQLLKIQTDETATGTLLAPEGSSLPVGGTVWAKAMDPNLGTIHATQVASDGSLYVLADAKGTVANQDIRGSQDVVLQKFDSAGKLLFTRTLGANTSASGLAMAISPDGRVAIAGKSSGALSGATLGALNSPDAKTSDSFVTTFDSKGNELWTKQVGSRLDDEATHLTFGANGVVYVAGRTKSNLPSTDAVGGWDSYIQGIRPGQTQTTDNYGVVSTTYTGTAELLFSKVIGTAGADQPGGLVEEAGSLYLATSETGQAVVRKFDVASGTAVETASRNLGNLEGGNIAGIAIADGKLVVAGNTSNGALDLGLTTQALAGGVDGFVARLDTSLTDRSLDALSYYGGTGDDKVSGLAVSSGQVYISGQSGGDLPDLATVGTKDGFVAQINLDTGNADWSTRFTSTGGYADPTSLAIDDTGGSILDQLGLPKGTIGGATSTQLMAESSLRAGDQLRVRAGNSTTITSVTIAADETLTTLATKLKRAMNNQADVSTTLVDGVRRLQIKPQTNRNHVELYSGPVGKDALKGLGLPEGIIRSTTLTAAGKSIPADGRPQIYGLKFDPLVNLSDSMQVSHAAAELAAAMGVIRKAYNDLRDSATPDAILKAASGKGGTVPAYLTNQIATYKSALARLGG